MSRVPVTDSLQLVASDDLQHHLLQQRFSITAVDDMSEEVRKSKTRSFSEEVVCLHRGRTSFAVQAASGSNSVRAESLSLQKPYKYVDEARTTSNIHAESSHGGLSDDHKVRRI